MYNSAKDNGQTSFIAFNTTCGLQLDPENEWVRAADAVSWGEIEDKLAVDFGQTLGRPGISIRKVIGVMMIQMKKNLTDRPVLKEIAENPYLQYFIGNNNFVPKAPFCQSTLSKYRKRLPTTTIIEINNSYLRKLVESAKPCKNTDHEEAKSDEPAAVPDDNAGIMIEDATCSPSNIKYPQDFQILNDVRLYLEKVIDSFHAKYHPWDKPRTYRKIAKSVHLKLAKSKKRTQKQIRAVIKKELGFIRRDLDYIDKYMAEGYAMSDQRQIARYLTALEIYKQQLYMYKNNTHEVANRIVSLDQPFIRPIVRGKSKAPVEFGAKYDVTIDEKGHARLEHISFDAYNEGTILTDRIEAFRDRTGHYPEAVMVDAIYRTKENIAYCEKRNIRITGKPLGNKKKSPKMSKKEKQIEYKDSVVRIAVERFFSLIKLHYGAGLIMPRLSNSAINSIALSILVANLFATLPKGTIMHFFLEESFEGFNVAFILFRSKNHELNNQKNMPDVAV